MKQAKNIILEKLVKDNPGLAPCLNSLEKAFETITRCYSNGGKVLICGNGGSAADAEHITGELMKGFLVKRSIDARLAYKLKELFPADGEYLSANLQGALPAISLSSQTSLLTAFSNDVAPDMAFAQQVYGYGHKGDVLIGLSTSGNSSNVINALKVAKAMDMETVGFTGKDGGAMKDVCDILISVPAVETYRVQEFHLPLYHALCAMVEAEFFGDNR
jgi:D-sedoheptulose 7-phosphate isomerase